MTKDIKPKNVIILSDPVNARFLANNLFAKQDFAYGPNKKMTSYSA